MTHQQEGRSLYHRWRSRNFAEVVAQEHVTRTLRNAAARGRIVHAYLFCGPRGTGKTSTARILAKAVNCLQPQDGEPCNRCASCVSISEGRAIDLIEIDAASNRGIDDARELREKIKFSPAESKYKVYIIDEAHMLTSEASNALLKTLEEPPPHAILVLATTEAHKILPTIISRCQRFDFRRIPYAAIVSHLELIARAEGLRVERGVFERVARMARGSLRDAESLLDQLVAYCGPSVQLEAARDVLGLTGEEAVPELAGALRDGDLAEGIRLVDAAATKGADLRHLARELVEYLRALVASKSGAESSVTRELSGSLAKDLQQAASGWSYERLLAAMHSFAELEGRMRSEPFNQLHLELALMETVLASKPQEPLAAAEASPAPVVTQAVPVPGDALAQEQGEVRPPLEEAEAVAAVAEHVADAAPPPRAEESSSLPPLNLAGERALERLRGDWSRVIAELTSGGSHSVGMVLASSVPVTLDGTTLTLALKAEARRLAERQGMKAKVEDALGALLGGKVQVRFRYGMKVEQGQPPVAGRDPLVDAAMKEFGFRITRVEPSME